METYLKSLNYIGNRISLQKYRFRDYTADQQVYKGYIQSTLGAACVSRYEVAYPEPDKKAFKNGKPYEDDSLTQLILRPNKWMSETDFDRYTIKYQFLTGNCYWVKIREGKYGRLSGLFPFSDMNISPVGTPENFIEYYKFVTFDGKVTEYDPDDIIQMPFLYINPIYPNKGIAPGALAAREIDTDTEFGRHIASYVANYAIPGGLVEVSKEAIGQAAGVSETTAKKIKAGWRKMFSRSGAGDLAIMEPGFTYKTIGSNLKDLDLALSRATPEARTCALHLIPPEVVGVNVGMAHSTENNLAESRIRWTNNTLVPLWVQNQKKLSAGLQKEYPGVEIRYDIDSVAAVKEQKMRQIAPTSKALVELFTAMSSGAITEDAGRVIVEELFQLNPDVVERMFPEKSVLSNSVATPAGEVVEND